MIRVTTKGSFRNSMTFLELLLRIDPVNILHKYGKKGVEALSNATAIDTGITAASWYYVIGKEKNGYTLEFHNLSLTDDGIPIAILLQYGHTANNGAWIPGRDYINPALRDVFDQLSMELGREMSSK